MTELNLVKQTNLPLENKLNDHEQKLVKRAVNYLESIGANRIEWCITTADGSVYGNGKLSTPRPVETRGAMQKLIRPQIKDMVVGEQRYIDAPQGMSLGETSRTLCKVASVEWGTSSFSVQTNRKEKKVSIFRLKTGDI